MATFIDITPDYPALFKQILEHGLRPSLARMRLEGEDGNLREVLAYVNVTLSCAADVLARLINARDESEDSAYTVVWGMLDAIMQENTAAIDGYDKIKAAREYAEEE